jgi:hypothetical protein
MGGSYGHGIDQSSYSPMAGEVFTMNSITDLGNNEYTITHDALSTTAVNQHVSLRARTGTNVQYLMRITQRVSDTEVRVLYETPEIPFDISLHLDAYTSLHRTHYRYNVANTSWLAANATVQANQGGFFGVTFSDTSATRRSWWVAQVHNDKSVDAFKEVMQDVANGVIQLYTRYGDANDVDVSMSIRGITGAYYDTWDVIGEPLTIEMSVDPDRLYATGYSYGALYWTSHIPDYEDYLAGILALDGMSTDNVEMIAKLVELFNDQNSDYFMHDYEYNSTVTWDPVARELVGSTAQATYFVSEKRVKEWRKRFLMRIGHMPIIDYTSTSHSLLKSWLYCKQEMLKMVRADPDLKDFVQIYTLMPVKSPVDETYSFDTHSSSDLMYRGGGLLKDGHIFVIDQVRKNTIAEFHPQLPEAKTGMTPMDLLFTFRLSQHPPKRQANYPPKIKLQGEHKLDSKYQFLEFGGYIAEQYPDGTIDIRSHVNNKEVAFSVGQNDSRLWHHQRQYHEIVNDKTGITVRSPKQFAITY